MADLADRFLCVALDLKGHGQSDVRLDSDSDHAAQARELPAVLDGLGIDRFHLVTHDRGSVIGDHLCAGHFLHLEAPEDTAAAIRAFLTRDDFAD